MDFRRKCSSLMINLVGPSAIEALKQRREKVSSLWSFSEIIFSENFLSSESLDSLEILRLLGNPWTIVDH